MELIPRSFDTAVLPQGEAQELPDGHYQGVHFTLPIEQLNSILEKIESWFADRDEVILIATGSTQKAELGFITMEWDGYEIDPLFLAILRDDEFVEDFSIYTRSEEAYQ